MSITSKFNFIGNVVIPKPKDSEHSNYYYSKMGGRNNDLPIRKISFIVKESRSNSGYVDMFGSKYPIIKTIDKNNNRIEVPWEDRNNPETLDLVAFYKKFIVDLGPEFGGKHEFITEYDAIGYLGENLQAYANTGGKLYVTGQMKKNFYNGNCTDRFQIKDVYAVEPDRASRLEITMDLYYNDDSIDTNDLNAENKIYVNGYIAQYTDKENGIQYIPQTVTMSFAKYDLTNIMHVKRMEYRKGYISKLSKKKMYHIMWQCRLINGAEEIQFDKSMLTEQQKEQVALGIKSLDDFKPSSQVLGDKIHEIRLVDPILKGSFSEGILECDETLNEFLDNVYVMPETETLGHASEHPKEEQKEDVLKSATIEDEFVELF